MASGGPGDHPLNDILHWKLPVYSPKIDGLISDIVRFGGPKDLEANFDLFAPPPDFETQLQRICADLRKEAKERGWEIDD